MEEPIKILDTHILENGFEIDLDEGWHKLITSQFGGSPGRAFCELIQNAIDSYPSETPWKNRKGTIVSSGNSIGITDWGEGFNLKKLSLLVTAGGTDKSDNPEKIGQFGLGFISIFNPKLGTKKVEIITRCEGQVVQVAFTVNDPAKRPDIALHMLDTKIDYSTSITIEFSDSKAVKDCLHFAEKSLNYYPCAMTINHKKVVSVWHAAEGKNSMVFSENNCDGIISKQFKWQNMSLLCKYELVQQTSLPHFITGGHHMKYNLEDYETGKTPYLPDISLLFNINNLTLVISRDNYYLNSYYYQAKKVLNNQLRQFLSAELSQSPDPTLIIANQFLFRHEINAFLSDSNSIFYDQPENKFIKQLADLPVYRLNGRSGLFSIRQLMQMLRPGNPLYFSPARTNLRWLGGSFRHDFIVIPASTPLLTDIPDLYEMLFEGIFIDTVNLDTISLNATKIEELVKRGLVDQSALLPKCEIIGFKKLNDKQLRLVQELETILEDTSIKEIISNNLFIKISSITPVFFTIEHEGAYLSTGLFNKDGTPVTGEEMEGSKLFRKTLLLGLNMHHPFIKYLVECTSVHREYYTLTYIAHELALCQKMLVPYSPYYHLVKEKIVQEMRVALTHKLINTTVK